MSVCISLKPYRHGISIITALLLTATVKARDFSGWQTAVNSPNSAVVTQQGMLDISCNSPEFKPVIIRPAEAVPLPEDISRLRLWFAELEGEFNFTFLLLDGKGRERSLNVESSRSFNSTIYKRAVMKEFSCWHQADSTRLLPSAPINERVVPEFQARAKQLDWPRPYRLAGIMLTPIKKTSNGQTNKKNVTTNKRRVLLAQWDAIAYDGLTAESNCWLEERDRWSWNAGIRLYPDDLCAGSGLKIIRLELRQGFQGPVVWQETRNIKVDRNDHAALYRQAIELPVPPRGRYFLEAKVWNAEARLEDTRWMQLYVFRSPVSKINSTNARLELTSKERFNVFPPDTKTASLQLNLSNDFLAELPKDARCRITITDWLGQKCFAQDIPATATAKVNFTSGRPGNAYLARCEVVVDSKILDVSQLYFGIANKPERPAAIPARVPTRDELMKGKVIVSAEHWAPFLRHYGPMSPPVGYGITMTPKVVASFDRWIESLPAAGIQLAAFYFPQNLAEPLPGVYCWEEIDRRVALAGKLGLQVMLTPTYPGDYPYMAPLWSDTMPTLDQHGYPVRWPSFWSWKDTYFDFLTRVATHFSGNPTVVAYNTEKLLYADRQRQEPDEIRMSDYEPATQISFDAWRRSMGKPIIPLAKRFTLPGADTPAGIGPDLSDAWQAFCDFRAYCYYEWVKRTMSAIRAVDPKRTVVIYQGPRPSSMVQAIPLLKDGGTFLPEGGPVYSEHFMASLFEQAGIPYANEPLKFIPQGPSYLDSCYFYSGIYGRNAFWKFRWHQACYQTPALAQRLNESFRFINHSLPAYRRWYAAEPLEPEGLLVGSRVDNLLSDTKIGVTYKEAGIPEFCAFYEFHQLQLHYANEYSDWVDFSRFKLVVVVGDVIRKDVVERIEKYLKNRGKVLLIGAPGKYTPELPTVRNLLQKRLHAFPEVRTIKEPRLKVPTAQLVRHSNKMFDEKELSEILRWAGIVRPARTSAGFDVTIRKGADGERFLAVFRRVEAALYPGTMSDREIQKTADAEVTVHGLPAGKDFVVTQFHRKECQLGTMTSSQEGALDFKTSGMEQGELRLFSIKLKE